MKTFLKVTGVTLLAVVALAAIGVSWLALRKPAQRPAAAETIERTPERVARGEYLVHHVTDCVGCHSEHTLAYALPIKPGSEGARGFVWDQKFGFPGVVAAANITPDPETGLGAWTDGEILRAIREGVDRHGKALFPIMPYTGYHQLADEDAKAIVAYLRTMKPIRYQRPPKQLDVPLNFVEKFIPKPVEAPVVAPDPNDSVAYGKYLTVIGGCYECHTPHDKKGPIESQSFSGGEEFKGPWGRNLTSNLTPHPNTFVGRATKDEWIGRFRAFANVTADNAPTPQPGRNTVMPWIAFAGMTDHDLGAIYDYLKTVKPIDKRVNAFPDAR
ncbi:MAG TPA: c-type cytochrome [Thermoanaerobaculia bacterium]|jgi:mono/diheme cytochrome c family protein